MISIFKIYQENIKRNIVGNLKNKNNVHNYFSNIFKIISYELQEYIINFLPDTYFYDIYLKLHNFIKSIKIGINLHIPNLSLLKENL